MLRNILADTAVLEARISFPGLGRRSSPPEGAHAWVRKELDLKKSVGIIIQWMEIHQIPVAGPRYRIPGPPTVESEGL